MWKQNKKQNTEQCETNCVEMRQEFSVITSCSLYPSLSVSLSLSFFECKCLNERRNVSVYARECLKER